MALEVCRRGLARGPGTRQVRPGYMSVLNMAPSGPPGAPVCALPRSPHVLVCLQSFSALSALPLQSVGASRQRRAWWCRSGQGKPGASGRLCLSQSPSRRAAVSCTPASMQPKSLGLSHGGATESIEPGGQAAWLGAPSLQTLPQPTTPCTDRGLAPVHFANLIPH